MTFEDLLDQAMAMPQRRGRLTYSTLKRQFQLDDAALEDVKNEIIYGQRLAVIGEPGVGKTRLVYEFTRSHHTHYWSRRSRGMPRWSQ
jgi:MoxR-like ATPase